MQVQAEKAAWDVSKELNISLVTILPSMILGPVLSKRGGFSVDTFAVRIPPHEQRYLSALTVPYTTAQILKPSNPPFRPCNLANKLKDEHSVPPQAACVQRMFPPLKDALSCMQGHSGNLSMEGLNNNHELPLNSALDDTHDICYKIDLLVTSPISAY